MNRTSLRHVHPLFTPAHGLLLALVFSFPVPVASQEPGTGDTVPPTESTDKTTEPTDEQANSPSTAAEVQEPIKLDGVFQAVHTDGVRIDLKEWSSVSVVEAVEHGAKVQAGDVLIKLELDKLEQAIEEARREIATDELAVEDAKIKLDLARRSQELALRAAAASDRIATEDLKDFITIGRDQKLASLAKAVQSSQNRLDYQREELKQLEQMYGADDLTEETEEIILKRTRDAVESAEYSLQVVRDIQRQGIEFDIPRSQENLETAVIRTALALEEARRTAPQTLQRQELQLEQQQADLQKKKSRLERLRDDLQGMQITAARSGVVYYGAPDHGKWVNPASVDAMLQPGGKPKTGTDLMTVVQLRPLNVRVAVPEDAFRHVEPGTQVTVEPIAYPQTQLAGRVVNRSAIPISDGQFEAIVELEDSALRSELVPAMKVRVIVTPAQSKSSDSKAE